MLLLLLVLRLLSSVLGEALSLLAIGPTLSPPVRSLENAKGIFESSEQWGIWVAYLRPTHPEHPEKGGCWMPSARFPHLKGVGWSKDQLMKVYKALHLSLLRCSGVATLGRPFRHRAAGALPKQSPEGGYSTFQIHPS